MKKLRFLAICLVLIVSFSTITSTMADSKIDDPMVDGCFASILTPRAVKTSPCKRLLIGKKQLYIILT